MCRFSGKVIADRLNGDRNEDQGDHAAPDDVLIPLFGIAVVVTEGAHASAADGTDDRRQPDQGDKGDRRGTDDARNALALDTHGP